MRTKKSILIPLSLATLVLGAMLVVALFPKPAEAHPDPDWWDADWQYRMPINITENSGFALTNYQVLVTLNTATFDYSKAKANGDDMRFTSTGAECDYWIETWSPSGESKLWVEVPSIPASGAATIYMYYGNPDASSASDGGATFVFFDDFSGDLSKWNIHIDTDVVITSGYGNPAPSLEIRGGTTSSPYGFAAIGSDATYTGFQDGIIEADIYPATVALPEIIFRGDYSANTGYKGRWDCRSGTETPWMKPPYSGWTGFGAAVARFGIANQWQKVKLVISGSTFRIYSNDNLKSTATNTQYSGPGEIGLANHYGAYARFDDVRVRKYASPEPTISIGSEEQLTVSIAISPASYDFGIVAENEIKNTTANYFTLTNNGNITVNTTIQGTDATGETIWILSDDALVGSDIYGLKFTLNGTDYYAIPKSSAADFVIGLSSETGSNTQTFGVQFLAPSEITQGSKQVSATITITAVAQ